MDDNATLELHNEADRLRQLSRAEQRAELRKLLGNAKSRGKAGQLLDLLGLPGSWLLSPAPSGAAAELAALERREAELRT